MTNVFMQQFKKRLIKALLVGAAIVLIVLLSPLLTKTNPFGELPWYIVPVEIVLCVLYGTGWFFAFNLIKRSFRKFLRVNRNASIWQAITGRGLILGIFYAMLCFLGGCILAFFVGNFFMIKDFLLAKDGKPPISMKYKFDSDLEYDSWSSDMATLRTTVEFSDNASNADSMQRFNNELNLQNIENGYTGTVTTDTKDGKKKTTINQ